MKYDGERGRRMRRRRRRKNIRRKIKRKSNRRKIIIRNFVNNKTDVIRSRI